MAHIDLSPANILEVGTPFQKSKTLLSAVSLDFATSRFGLSRAQLRKIAYK